MTVARHAGLRRRGSKPVPSTTRARALRWTLRGAAVVALGLVFASYLDPLLMVSLADRVWACF